MAKNKSKIIKKINSQKSDSKFPPQPVCFSFAHILKGCAEVKDKYFFFTNKVPVEKIKDYRTTIENAFRNWSSKTIQQLGKTKFVI